jgi:hypothetical protein
VVFVSRKSEEGERYSEACKAVKWWFVLWSHHCTKNGKDLEVDK